MKIIPNLKSENVSISYTEWLSKVVGETVSGEDKFLDVGGNSMIAISLNSKLQEAYGLDVDLLSLFTGSIDEAIALAIKSNK